MNNTSTGPSVAIAPASAKVNVTEGSGIRTANPGHGTPTWLNTTTGCAFPAQETPAGSNVTGTAMLGDKTIILTKTPTIITITTFPSNVTTTRASLTTVLATPSGWTDEIDSQYGSSVTAGRIGLWTGLSVFGLILITLALFGNFLPLEKLTQPIREKGAEYLRRRR
ncbi:hypothetical protein RBB50_002424 [Rhinocladiella similis]